MTGMTRLLDAGGDELALSLLRSADSDAPPEQALGRAAAALGVGAAFTAVTLGTGSSGAAAHGVVSALAPKAASLAASGGASGAWPATLALVAKPLALGMVGGALALGGISYATSPRAVSAPSIAPASTALVTSPSLRPHSIARGALPRDAIETPDVISTPAEVAKAANAPSSRSHLVTTPASAPKVEAREQASTISNRPSTASFGASEPTPPLKEADRSLARELALLDQARKSLYAGNPGAALRTLDQYVAERKTGALDTEASVLRINVLEKLGNHAAASRLAQRFLKEHPERNQDDVLRAIAGVTAP